MRIFALSLRGNDDWPDLTTPTLAAGLNVVHGPSASGKTTIADLISHSLYGRRLAPMAAENPLAPAGELIALHRGRHYRLRRTPDQNSQERLTVAALDQLPVDQNTVRRLVACLSPSLLQPLYAAGFHESPNPECLTSQEFSQQYRAALWRLKWSPPTVHAELRLIYRRLRGLETKVDLLLKALDTDEARSDAAKSLARRQKCRASYFLRGLTDGDLVRLRLGDTPAEAHVVTRTRESHSITTLWSTQRDQVYVSLCLALVSGLRRYGVRLPLILDEPFARLDARSTAALVTVLDEFARRGHQVVVFTARQEAIERFAARGVTLHEISTLQRRVRVEAPDVAATVAAPATPIERRRRKRRIRPAAAEHRSGEREQREAG